MDFPEVLFLFAKPLVQVGQLPYQRLMRQVALNASPPADSHVNSLFITGI